jgi:hypothetical protein
MNIGKPTRAVYKFTDRGELINSYPSVKDASEKNGITFNVLYANIKNQSNLSGYFYSFDSKICWRFNAFEMLTGRATA